jgi:hypothetical protein
MCIYLTILDERKKNIVKRASKKPFNIDCRIILAKEDKSVVNEQS